MSEIRIMEEHFSNSPKLRPTLSGASCHAEVPIVDRCFISGITLVRSRQATDATDHPGLAAGENEE
jgi:hypothetical protein